MNNGIFSAGSGWDVLFIGMLLCAAIGYFCGSVNFAVIISKLKYKQDIRTIGSGNAGMTNMLRAYGKGAAVLTLAGDIGKTVLSCFIGSLLLGESGAYLAGLFCMVGHVKPIFFDFKGGKGFLTLLATALYCNPIVCLILLTFFVIIVSFTKYISLGSMIFALFYPIILSRFSEPNIIITLCSLISAVIVLISHKENIKRLRNGNENKIHLGKDGAYLNKGVLIVLNIALTAITVGCIFLKISSVNGAWERRCEAAICGDYSYSQIQLRYIYIDCADGYISNEENADTELVKNYDKTKPYHEQYLSNGESYADFFMKLAKERAEYLLTYRSAAEASGCALPSEYQLESRFSSLNEAVEASGLEEAYYILDTYGAGMKRSDITSVLSDECYIGLYISQSDEDPALKASNYTVTFNEKAISKILEKY